MKLHELRPAPGSRRDRTRVGRGIAAGKGKTAGRGTKGQKSRAGAGIPAWFEGGQTPIHVRVPKLRGFRNPFKIEYQVVNVGRIAEYAAAGRFGVEGGGKTAKDPVTVNPQNLAAAGLIGRDDRPVKVLGQGDVTTALFVVADAFTGSARQKIEGAGGLVQLLNPPAEEPVDETTETTAAEPAETTAGEPAETTAEEPAETTAEATAEEPAGTTAEPQAEPKPRRKRASGTDAKP